MGRALHEIDRMFEQVGRRKFLQEFTYRLPASGDLVMYDWYTLYTLWWKIGAGKQTYGYTQDRPVTSRREDVVNSTFEEATRQLANRLVLAIQDAIYEEMENAADEFLIPDEVWHSYAELGHPFSTFDQVTRKHAGDTQGEVIKGKAKRGYGDADVEEEVFFGERRLPPRDQFFKHFSYQDCVKLFSAKFWEEHADAYGGKAWARITEALIELHDAVKRGKLKELIMVIDKIYDLQHNTGSLLSKTNLNVSKSALDYRAQARTLKDFASKVSPPVNKLITSAAGIAESVIERPPRPA